VQTAGIFRQSPAADGTTDDVQNVTVRELFAPAVVVGGRRQQLRGRVVEQRPDPELKLMDAISMRYVGKPFRCALTKIGWL
jgi:hypothetical protein